jgi:hypothetical protein
MSLAAKLLGFALRQALDLPVDDWGQKEDASRLT